MNDYYFHKEPNEGGGAGWAMVMFIAALACAFGLPLARFLFSLYQTLTAGAGLIR